MIDESLYLFTNDTYIWFNFFPSPFEYIRGLFIILGFYVNAKLFWMVIYEIKNKGDGEKYLNGELKKVKRPSLVLKFFKSCSPGRILSKLKNKP